MRITYYSFPEEIPIRQCIEAWKTVTGYPKSLPPPDMPEERIEENFPRTQDCTVTIAKKLLKKCGGVAFTQHFERDGTLFETTPIQLKGNNSRFKYNRHL